jgi:hypothetical protein
MYNIPEFCCFYKTNEHFTDLELCGSGDTLKRQCPFQDLSLGGLSETNLDYDEKTFQCIYESMADEEEPTDGNYACFYEKSTGALSKDDNPGESRVGKFQPTSIIVGHVDLGCEPS